MLNGVSWIGLVLIASARLVPDPALITVAIVLSLPVAVPFVLPTLGTRTVDETVVTCIVIGVNTLAWGYGVAWLWHNVFYRYSLRLLMSIMTVIAVLLGVAKLLMT